MKSTVLKAWMMACARLALVFLLLTCFMTGTGLTADKPSVKTGPVTQVTSESFTITGTANPNGSTTRCHFQFGTTPQYEQGSSGNYFAGSGTSDMTLMLVIRASQVNAVYHYRLVCENGAGVSYGADMTYKTKSSD